MSNRKYPAEPRAPVVLTVDVGGSHVKCLVSGATQPATAPGTGTPEAGGLEKRVELGH